MKAWICKFCCVLLHLLEELRKGLKKKKDSEKPDTFVEKLAVHLSKNLQVGVACYSRNTCVL